MGSVSVSSYICCMFVSCVHPVAVLNAAFCMTNSLLMLVEDARGDHTEEAYSCLVSSHECISFELLMCGGGVHSISLLPLVARCLETIDVCIWRTFVLCLL